MKSECRNIKRLSFDFNNRPNKEISRHVCELISIQKGIRKLCINNLKTNGVPRICSFFFKAHSLRVAEFQNVAFNKINSEFLIDCIHLQELRFQDCPFLDDFWIPLINSAIKLRKLTIHYGSIPKSLEIYLEEVYQYRGDFELALSIESYEMPLPICRYATTLRIPVRV